jgi:hypothetical protein
LIAESWLGHEHHKHNSADRYQVLVHMGSGARNHIENGPDLAAETARRLLCDTSVVPLFENEEGEPLNVGRKRRTIPAAISRALRVRDGCCRFPGCTHRFYLDGHHVEHWADGGETGLKNLVLLCRFHHRLVHEEGFGVKRSFNGDFVFTTPQGERIEPAPLLPGVGDNPADALIEMHRQLGLDIDENTAVTRWDGRPGDPGWMMMGLT